MMNKAITQTGDLRFQGTIFQNRAPAGEYAREDEGLGGGDSLLAEKDFSATKMTVGGCQMIHAGTSSYFCPHPRKTIEEEINRSLTDHASARMRKMDFALSRQQWSSKNNRGPNFFGDLAIKDSAVKLTGVESQGFFVFSNRKAQTN